MLGRLFVCQIRKKLFDKLTVKPESSESAALAVKTRYRKELERLSFLLSTFGAYAKVLSLQSTNFPRAFLRKQGGSTNKFEGFDPGSERTLAAWLRHASQTVQ